MELIVSRIRRKVSLITLLDRFRNITSRRMRVPLDESEERIGGRIYREGVLMDR